MPDNKHALIRYHVLDMCFSNPIKKYFIEDLIQACADRLIEVDPDCKGVSRRTIYDDMHFMESVEGWNAVIDRVKDGKRTYYRYADKNFSINNQPLNQAEVEQIKDALNILGRFKGMPQFNWINELVPKLEQAFVLEKDQLPIISFDNNEYLRGIWHLGPLFNYILYKKPLCITYQSFKASEPRKFIVHPYYLKQYNNRWFVLGLNQEFGKLSILALDRIVHIDEEPITYNPNRLYNFDEYFEDIIGVTITEGAEVEKIILEFTAETAPYILSKPLHGSQRLIEKNEEKLVVSIEVIINYELESLLLSFGERVKIIEPQNFLNNLLNRLEKTFKLYKT